MCWPNGAYTTIIDLTWGHCTRGHSNKYDLFCSVSLYLLDPMSFCHVLDLSWFRCDMKLIWWEWFYFYIRSHSYNLFTLMFFTGLSLTLYLYIYGWVSGCLVPVNLWSLLSFVESAKDCLTNEAFVFWFLVHFCWPCLTMSLYKFLFWMLMTYVWFWTCEISYICMGDLLIYKKLLFMPFVHNQIG